MAEIGEINSMPNPAGHALATLTGRIECLEARLAHTREQLRLTQTGRPGPEMFSAIISGQTKRTSP